MEILDDTLLAFSELQEGYEVNAKLINRINSFDEKIRAGREAMRYILRGYRTEKEVRDKLKKSAYTLSAAESAISQCKQNGYIDDEKYVRQYIERFDGARGAHRMKFELKQKGIDESLLKDIEDGYNGALEQARRFYAHKSDDVKFKEKFYRHMAARGFSYETIQAVYREVRKDADVTDD